jgi:DNA polymerase-2
VHRDQQTLLLGRLHLDPQNSMAFKDWGPQGTYETARLSNLPIQNAARRSAGGAFVGMQVAASLENGILVPIRKQQREHFKKATQLIAADNGGVIFKPIVGLHQNVAEIDFFSMYPNIMTGWNISAETVGELDGVTRWAPGIDAPIRQDSTGIVAMILKPIMEKRRAAKDILEGRADSEGYDLAYLQTTQEFLKGLGWVSYGYQGFSGNRIGSIEAHEAINAVSRDVILKAKQAAEDFGFEVLHVYVDSLFVRVGKNESRLNSLCADIQRRTGLRIEIEGILRWVVFLPSKQNRNVPVSNCFYGVFRSGELKCRGIMARRGDTPRYIAEVQLDAIKILVRETEFEKLPTMIPKVVFFFQNCHQELVQGKVLLEHLLISQTLSRDLEDFKVLSPASRAAQQLAADGKAIGAGQNVDFLRVKQAPFALSWHAVDKTYEVELDTAWYCEQLLRAADEVLQPLGVPKEILKAWLAGDGSYWSPEDFIGSTPVELPLLEGITQKHGRQRKPQFLR